MRAVPIVLVTLGVTFGALFCGSVLAHYMIQVDKIAARPACGS